MDLYTMDTELLKCEPEAIVKYEPLFTENSYDVTVNNDNLIKTECESVSFSSCNDGSLNDVIIKQECTGNQLAALLPTTNISVSVEPGFKEESSLPASEQQSQENTGNLLNSKNSTSCNQAGKSKTRTKTRHYCPYCNRNFIRRESFNIHLRRRHSKKNPDLVEKLDKTYFTCDTCKFKSPCSTILKSHMLMHETFVDNNISVHVQKKHSSDRHTYSCRFCTKTFFYKASLAGHLLCKHDNKFDKSLKTLLAQNIKHCKLCDFRTVTKTNLNNHMTKHNTSLVAGTDTIIYKCNKCDYETFKNRNLQAHRRKNHSNDRHTYSCRFCEKTWFRKISLADHLLRQHGEKFDKSLKTLHSQTIKHCQFCDFKTVLTPRLNEHMIKHAHSLVKADTDTMVFRCNNCDYETFQNCHLQTHIRRMHSNDRHTYSCRICNTAFFKKVSLADHLLLQHGEKFDKSLKTLLSQTIKHCQFCDFKTIFTPKLNQHMTKHDHSLVKTDTIVFRCNNCDYETFQKHYLQAHIRRMHSNDRQTYSCRVCNKTFINRRSLADHLLSQHGDKFDKSLKTLFSLTIKHCKLCEFRTITKILFIQHVAKHAQAGTEPIIFKCNNCDYEAYQKGNLRVHIQRKHSNVRPTYSCRFCNKPLFKKRSLADHLLRQHGEKFDKSLKTLFSLTIKHCKLCEFKTIFTPRLNEHMTKQDHSLVKADTDTIIYKCNNCDYETFKKRNLQTHSGRNHK